LIYSPTNLPDTHDAAIDAEIIDPTNPEIDSVAPGVVYEGQGDFGSRPALVVINGRNLIDNNTTVERLLTLNPGLDPTGLQVGQQLRVR